MQLSVTFSRFKMLYNMQSSYTPVIVPLCIPKGTSPNVDDITGCTVIRGMQLTVPYARTIL